MNNIELQNKNGNKISITLRKFQPNDAEKIVNLIHDEYGESYFKPNFYNPQYLIDENEIKKIIFLVAECENGDIVGVLSLNPKDKICDIATGIVLKKYRGYNIMWHIFNYAVDEIKNMKNIHAGYCKTVLYHVVTQRLMEKINFVPCGFMMSEFFTSDTEHSYQKDDNIKHPHGILVRRMQIESPKIIYLPQEHTEIAKKIYSKLNLKCKIKNELNNLSGKSEISYNNDESQNSCTIKILSSGEDLITKINEIQSKFTAKYQTFNILLNICDKKSVLAYNELLKLNYFFTGFLPLFNDIEIMILHNKMNVPFNFDSLILTEKFSQFKDYVQNEYLRRY